MGSATSTSPAAPKLWCLDSIILCASKAVLWRPVNILSLTKFVLQTLIRYILKQDLPMSLDDSLTLAEAYKLPTSQIYYLYLIQLIAQAKVG